MTKSRSSHVRLKIIALLAALVALWGFAAVVTVREGLNVLFVSTVDREVGRPSNLLVGALQQERRISMVALNGGAEARTQLDAVRVATDGMLAAWREHVDSQRLRMAASDQLESRLAEADQAFAALAELRSEVDTGRADRGEVLAGYTDMIDAGFTIYTAVSSIDDQEIAKQAATLVTLTRAREVLSQEDALLIGALSAGSLTEAELIQLTQLVGTQRFLYANLATELSSEDQHLYQAAMSAEPVENLRGMEDRLLRDATPGATPPVSVSEWEQAIGPAMGAILEMEIAAADRTLDRANTARTWVIVRLLLAGGLGLIAVLAAVIISVTTARSLIRQLERLRDAARDLARNRLPRVVDRLSAGEKVDVAVEAPPLRFGRDEIGQVGQAFNAVQETAVRAAVQQAELRHGIRDVFLSLARRTQSLVHKQLSVLDGMERRETDADEMEEIYRVDHLATRMRRNAENLIVLSGASPGRTWRRPVQMIDVVRGAVAEVEDYTRVSLLPVEAGALEGRAVGDTIHLLAELIENAASFSPPYAKVGVAGQRVAHGFVVEIEDRGLGMTEQELATANEKLANPPDFSLADASRLGHYVVAKLAQRHGIKVSLRSSPYGGIVAIVLVPANILAAGGDQLGRGTADGDGGTGTPVIEGHVAGPTGPQPVGSDGATNPATPTDLTGATAPFATLGRQTAVAPPVEPPGRGSHEARHRLNSPPLIEQLRPGSPPSPGGSTPAGTGAPSPAPAPRPALPIENGEAPERRTPSGLPWRVRQASLPKQLSEEPEATGGDADSAAAARDPEQVRMMMRAYQRGTQRGRVGGAGQSDELTGSLENSNGATRDDLHALGEPSPGHRDPSRTPPEYPADRPEG